MYVHVQSTVHVFNLCSHAGMIALCAVGTLLLIGGGFAGERVIISTYFQELLILHIV